MADPHRRDDLDAFDAYWVEVRVDDGPWTDADLAPTTGADLWRPWVLRHDFRRGRHTLTVRATTADGETRPEARTDPFPSGATGCHTVQVDVR